MTVTKTLVLITADPDHPIANHAYRYVKASLTQLTGANDTVNQTSKQDHNQTDEANPVSVFFYGNAAHTANELRWQVADRDNLMHQWQQLSDKYGLSLAVCVSTALTRGITDFDNAKRHQLSAHNIASGFELVGLGELANMLADANNVVQF